ncbi:hypothetical protein Tco_1044417 [Tanacetum coccineum]|uniref:Uncharacterized protein n=1 Tax=Tanacetum coccineum TaxID=301880 RepID=A0ABQ5GS21_9ASTR
MCFRTSTSVVYMSKNLEKFKQALKEEMVEDLRYFNSLEKEVEYPQSKLELQRTQFSNTNDQLLEECYYNDHMCAILRSYDVDQFVDVKHCINLELALQNEKEKNVCENSWGKQSLTSGNNEKVWKDQNDSLIAELNRKTLEINDLRAQLQEKIIANTELRERMNHMKGKYMETKFEKPSVVCQPNAFKFQKPSALGRPTPFADLLEKIVFSKQKSRSVPKTNVK